MPVPLAIAQLRGVPTRGDRDANFERLLRLLDAAAVTRIDLAEVDATRAGAASHLADRRPALYQS